MYEKGTSGNALHGFSSPVEQSPTFEPGTSATDNFLAMLKNNVVILEPSLKFSDPPGVVRSVPTTGGESGLEMNPKAEDLTRS